MTDELVMGVLPGAEIRVLAACAGQTARTARERHHTEPAASQLLAQSLCASALLTGLSLGKGVGRVNLQLECDGPLRGLLAESDASGHLRGYVKNPYVVYEGASGGFHWRPVLGNKGFISVLRELPGGEYFRSSVELVDFDLGLDLERYFATSDQIPTAVFLQTLPVGEEPLGQVVGLLLQPMPQGDRTVLHRERQRLGEGGELRGALASLGAGESAAALLTRLFPGEALEVTSRYPLSWHCPCSNERVLQALSALGPQELADVLEKDGKAEATCHFCNTVHVVGPDALRALIARLGS